MKFLKQAGGWFSPDGSAAVDAHLDRLDTKGVSRRDLLALGSAGLAATAFAGVSGLPNVALASADGKLAYLAWTSRVEFMIQASRATEAATREFGFSYSYLDGQMSSQTQLDQAEQQLGLGVNAIILHAPDGSAVRRIAEYSAQNKTYFSNVWATLPWLTPSMSVITTRSMRCPKSSRPMAR